LDPAYCLTLDNINIDVERLGQSIMSKLRDRIALIFEEYSE